MTKIYTLSDPLTKEIRYVGKTTQSLQIRINRHVQDCKRKRNHRECWIFGLFKKGLKPEIELLELVSDSEWQDFEKFYISYFKFLGFRLTNIAEGGLHKIPASVIARKLSMAGMGRKHNEKSKRKISLANSGKNNGMYGVIISQSEKDKRRKFHTGKKMKPESIEKTRLFNLGRKNTIESKIKMRNSSPNKKMLIQFDLNGNLIKVWESLSECCRITSFQKNSISKCCRGKSKTSHGFKWKYN